MLALTVPETLLAYLHLDGDLLQAAIGAALSGDQELEDHAYDLLAQALNDYSSISTTATRSPTPTNAHGKEGIRSPASVR